MKPSRDISGLIEIMAALRHPETGCPWDIKQDFSTIKPYTIEEAYEVADAIERNDPEDLCDELGDLLLQVVFHARERRERRAARGLAEAETPGQLTEVPRALPALMEALKLQQAASQVGFDWGAAGPVLDKIEEEIGELRAEIASGRSDKASDELGDVIFAVANLARHLKADPEDALRSTNTKFRTRFAYVEAGLTKLGKTPEDATLAEMEALWQEAKQST